MASRIVLLLIIFLVGCTKEEICQDDQQCISLMISAEQKGWEVKEKAIKELKILCKESNSSKSCEFLGEYYKMKNQDFLAAAFFARSCKKLSDRSCLENGMALERINQQKKALDSYYYGCLLANGGKSCEALGDFFSHQREWEGAAVFYKKSCDKGTNGACSKMANITMSYLPSFKNKEKYYKEYFSKACNGNDYYSCFFLGELFFDEGKKNKAKEFFYKACLGGLNESCEIFKENYGSLWEKKKKRLLLWWDFLLKRLGLR